jgi:hypothetical protein
VLNPRHHSERGNAHASDTHKWSNRASLSAMDKTAQQPEAELIKPLTSNIYQPLVTIHRAAISHRRHRLPRPYSACKRTHLVVLFVERVSQPLL